nr:hypothetical protein [Tanacetum cinerariifolium]
MKMLRVRPCTKKEATVSLTVGADPTIGFRRENQNVISRVIGSENSLVMGRVGPAGRAGTIHPHKFKQTHSTSIFATQSLRPGNPLYQDFTSEYGISEALHPELLRPGDRIVDFPEDECVFPTAVDWRSNASKDGMPTNGTYSVEDVIALDTHQMDLFSLIRASNPTKVKTGSRPRAPHELPLLTLTASRVIEMDEPTVATDSSSVPSTIERSPLDFAHEVEASGRETVALKMPPPKDVPINIAPETDQAVETIVVEPPAVREIRKRGHEGIDANAPSKSLRRDHADLRPLGVPADVSDPDPLAFADAPSPHPADVAKSSQGIAVAEDPESENVSSPAEVGSPRSVAIGWQLRLRFEQEAKLLRKSVAQVARRDQRIQARESEIKNLKALLEMKASLWGRDTEGRLLGLQATARPDGGATVYRNGCRRWVIRHGLRLAMMKCVESLEMRQAFADVVSTGVAKGMSEGLKHGVEHGHAQLTVESLEAYDPEAEAKFAAALQSLKDLKYPLMDQLEGLKDASMDEEIGLADAITANISRAEQKKRSRIVCRTHGVGSAHYPRSDRVPVSAPIVVPHGLVLLLVDAATQTESDDA